MKLRAYQIPADVRESGFDWLLDDDGRRWSVVTSEDHESGARCGEYRRGSWKFTRDEYRTASADYRRICAALDIAGYYGDRSDWKGYIREVAADYGVTLGARCWRHVAELARRYWDAYNSEKPEIVAALLSFVTRMPYTVTAIRGCCQGDYATLVIPSAEIDARAEIEARYFNTGDEWRIEDDAGEEHRFYTWKWGREGEQLTSQAANYWDNPEITIYEITGFTSPVPIYSDGRAA